MKVTINASDGTSGELYMIDPRIQQANNSCSRDWASSLQSDLTTIAAWAAGELASQRSNEWEALSRVSFIENAIPSIVQSWTAHITALSLHFDCAVALLLPSRATFRETHTRATFWKERPCTHCLNNKSRMPEPPTLLREAVAAATAASALPKDGTNMDPKHRVLVKYIINTVMSNQKQRREDAQKKDG